MTPATVPTGRSFQDLPPHPPTAEIPEPPPPEAAAPPRPVEAERRWAPLVALGALALVAGVAVGLWSPWDASGDRPASTTTLPTNPIAPPGLPSTTLPPATDPPSTLPAPAPPGGDGFTRPPPSGEFSFRFPGLVDPASVPDPWTVVENGVEIDNRGVRQRLVLEGPAGRAEVQAALSPDGSLPGDGEAVEVRGTQGRLAAGDESVTLEWVEDGMVRVVITAPAGTPPEEVVALAEALEVAP